MSGAYALGIDVGGTFTDVALVRLSDGAAFHHKTPSTPDDPSRAVGTGIAEILAQTAIAPDAIGFFGHGTTVATNALITGALARTGMITTDGFRDILEIRRQRQPHNYDIRMPKPPPVIPRRLRRELPERTYLHDLDNVPPDMAALAAILDDFDGVGVEAIAICFLHSYANPRHEQQVAAAVRARCPGVFVCASHEVHAEFREFERITSTAVNAALGPVMARYLGRVEERARALGVRAPQILQSNGGVTSAREAGAKPVRTLVSGPAAGVVGAVHVARQCDVGDIITFDVGGTSTDVCLIEGGRPLIARERLFHGHPVRFPMIDVHSVGAGGGSIGAVDAGGFLHVGPRSAGAHPGPACYGLGGTAPTVTDANVVLGRLAGDALLEGRLPLKADLAHRAVADAIATPMGLDVAAAAAGMLTILNENMVQAIRVISVEQGYDPRRFALVAFGGAGPLLASSLARELAMERIVVPPRPGLLCAQGLLMADARSDFSLTRIAPLAGCPAADLNDAFDDLRAQAARWFDHEGVAQDRRSLAHAIDMRYLGQSHELTVAVKAAAFTDRDRDALAAAFRAEHERVYGYASDAPAQIVTFRLTAHARMSTPPLTPLPAGAAAPRPLGERPVCFNGRDFLACPLYSRDTLGPGARIEGPAIIAQMDTTTVVVPDQLATVHPSGSLILTFRR